MTTVAQLNEPTHACQWCPGCGDHGGLLAIKQAISELGIEPHKVVVTSGVGCSSKLPHYIKTYGFESLHGRSLPPATGIKFSNHDLKVISVGGDGDGYGIGVGHFVHSMRRNFDIIYMVLNNQLYALTTGQASPTTGKGIPTKSTPHGTIESPLNPIALALASNCTFVARGYAGDVRHLTDLLKAAINHRGFSFIDCLQPCVSFNKINTYAYFQQHCYKLDEKNHDKTSFNAAMEKAFEWEKADKIPIGIFYQKDAPTYEDEIYSIKNIPLYRHDVSNVNIQKLLDEFV